MMGLIKKLRAEKTLRDVFARIQEGEPLDDKFGVLSVAYLQEYKMTEFIIEITEQYEEERRGKG